jgi:Endonuclease/Exonuclease/phosphatase family
MSISVLSWNIQEFGKNIKGETPEDRKKRLAKRLKAVAKHIRAQTGDTVGPDVFGLLEIEDVNIVQLMEKEFPNHDFFITESQRKGKEIIVGCRQDAFDQKAFTSKDQFDLYNPYLRPGALLSGRKGTDWYNFLFLHTDSGTEARDFGNRDEMLGKIWKLRTALDKKKPTREKLVVLGDLNTMGLYYPKRIKANRLVTGEAEVTALHQLAKTNKMKLPPKSHTRTYKKLGRNLISDLDHVITSDNLTLETIGTAETTGTSTPYQVQVSGWVDKKTKEKREDFIRNISDHCSLFLRVH